MSSTSSLEILTDTPTTTCSKVDTTTIDSEASGDWMEKPHPLPHQNIKGLTQKNKDAAIMFFKAKKYTSSTKVCELMLSRIEFYFLTFAGTDEFLDLTVKELYTLLSADTIGVNSECEIFFAAMRWLEYKFEERRQYIEEIVSKCVRFGNLPVRFLYRLMLCLDGEDEHESLLLNPVMKAMSENDLLKNCIRSYFCFLSICAGHYGKFKGITKLCAERQVKLSYPRKWIFDPECPYHAIYLEFPYKCDMKYSDFIGNIARIQLDPEKHRKALLHCPRRNIHPI